MADIRTPVVLPGFGTPLPSGGGVPWLVPQPQPDCADGPWRADPAPVSYGTALLDQAWAALDAAVRAAAAPLEAPERGAAPAGACCRVLLTASPRQPVVQL